ncbi:MAG: DHH family phosphoesterase [Clostridiales bacterium]|nr:DHH family phosphoesterase [Clostridiales bacterium]
MKVYRAINILIGVLLAGLCFAIGYFHLVAGIVACGAALLCVGVVLLLESRISKRQKHRMDQVLGDNKSAAAQLISFVAIPALVMDKEGRIVWRNEAALDLYDGKNIRGILPQYQPDRPTNALQTLYRGNSYQVMHMALKRPHAPDLIFQYWLDRTEAVHYQRLYTEQMPYFMLIYVDNYEELTGDQQLRRMAVMTEVERLIEETVNRIGGVYRRYENGRFLCLIEAKQLEQLEKERFALLDAAHRIETGTGAMVSLSLAVGVAPRLALSEESARSAMELALGRGGDQVVIKEGADYRFYGGKRQRDTGQSRVKARLFAKALHQLFENSGDVFIMGHRHSDMDCVGAALGIATCAMHIGSRAYLVLSGAGLTIADAVAHIESDNATRGLIVTPEQARAMLKPSSVLVVVDTQRASTSEAPELIELCQRVVLIDHHRRGADYIEKATLHLLESRASSASEMVAEVMQYFDEGVRPTAFTCSALLAGITVDTKQFAFNVGSRTFDAAGYLRRHGADLGTVKLMFQNDFSAYVACSNVVQHAALRESGIAVSVVPPETEGSKLLAAQAADELLSIRGVRAAFVLGRDGEVVFISGRSYGRVNVQLILEQLGGGGHLTMAGAQLPGATIDEARARLEALIEQYEETNPM